MRSFLQLLLVCHAVTDRKVYLTIQGIDLDAGAAPSPVQMGWQLAGSKSKQDRYGTM
jgi:hypothetical protein